MCLRCVKCLWCLECLRCPRCPMSLKCPLCLRFSRPHLQTQIMSRRGGRRDKDATPLRQLWTSKGPDGCLKCAKCLECSKCLHTLKPLRVQSVYSVRGVSGVSKWPAGIEPCTCPNQPLFRRLGTGRGSKPVAAIIGVERERPKRLKCLESLKGLSMSPWHV